MITLGQRVIHAIDAVERGEYEFALEDVAVAIDISAQRQAGASQSRKSDYKAFLDSYYWIIELMALNGIDLEKSTFENVVISGVKGSPRMPDVIYHLVRCGLVHSTGLPSSVQFVEGRRCHFARELIVLPAQVLWSLLACVVFAKININEQSEGNHFLEYQGQKFRIADHWGREDLVRPIYDSDVKVRVALRITPFT